MAFTRTSVLKSWVELNEYLKTCTLENVKDLITYEEATKSRTSYLVRLYQRYYTLLLNKRLRELRNEDSDN